MKPSDACEFQIPRSLALLTLFLFVWCILHDLMSLEGLDWFFDMAS